MNDKKILRDMLQRAKITFTEDSSTIHVERGYIGFATTFEFDKKTGMLKDMGAYE